MLNGVTHVKKFKFQIWSGGVETPLTGSSSSSDSSITRRRLAADIAATVGVSAV